MLLYKYRNCAQRTWELLLNRKLFFSTAAGLNDPLDASINIQAEYERAKAIVEAADDHPEMRRSFLIYLLNAQDKWKDPKSGKPMGLNGAVQLFLQSLGILSFSQTPTDALLWSHYAQGHCGLCLGFDADMLPIENEFLRGKIEYVARPPYVDLFLKLTEELGEFVRPWDKQDYPAELGDKFYTSQLSRLIRANLLCKSEKWKYEEEYRLVTSMPGLQAFDPKALKVVIDGAKLSSEDSETLTNILRHPDYAHVERRKVHNVAGTFEFGLSDAAIG